MNREFKKALALHRERYPLMEPQDWVKLAYQCTMGPGHHVVDFKDTRDGIIRELALVHDAAPYRFDPVSGGLARLHLRPSFDTEAVQLLARLFIDTAQRPAGGLPALLEALQLEESMPDMSPFLANYRAAGCLSLHHSDTFRDAYRPHYRLIQLDYAVYFPILWKITHLLSTGQALTLAIDGPCGSGKTRLSEVIARAFPCEIVHTDDFYLPVSQRAPGWEGIPAGNMDLERLRRQVLLPVSQGETAVYRPYDCASDSFGGEVRVPGGGLTILEGSYSHHPDLQDLIDLRIFLTCSDAQQRARLEQREGMNYFDYASCWVPMEHRYFEALAIPSCADMTVDTTDFFRIL